MSFAGSESLLNEILLLLQTLNSGVDEVQTRLKDVEQEIASLRKDLETIRSGFPDSDPNKHRTWHEKTWFGQLFKR